MSDLLAQLQNALADRYRIERQLGAGGMATVYLAEDLKHRRLVAVKVLKPQLAAVLGPERFLQEITTTAALQHPHILPLFDSGSAGGFLYYVMPFIDGETLRGRLEVESQLGVEEAVRIAAEVADALDYAHRHGVIHRDIKPENILLHDGRAMVADFGIALAVREAGAARITETGFSLGTPQYMSPEQAAADRRLDGRSDEYSLGVVLYEMLAGEPPFTGRNGQAVIAKVITQTAPPVRSLRAMVPAVVEAALTRALAKAPADRFPTVAGFAAALRGASQSVPVSPRRSVAWMGAGMLAAALAGAALWAASRHPAPAKTDSEVIGLYQRALRSYDRRTVAGALEAIGGLRAVLERDSTFAPGWTGLAKTYVRVYIRNLTVPGVPRDSVVKLAVIAADRALAADSASADAWVAQAMVNHIVDPTDAEPTLRSLRRALALDSSSGPAWHQYAMALAESGDHAAALTAWRRCISVAPGYAEGMAFRGLADYWRGEYDSAQGWADSAVTLDPNYLLARVVAGQVAVERGDYAKGAAAYDAARRLSDGVEVANALAGGALVAARAGRREEARVMLRSADSLASSYFPAPLHTAVFMAEAYAGLGETNQAIAWLSRYAPRADLHFQLHLRCDPPLATLAEVAAFRALLLPGRPRGKDGCGKQ